MTTSFIPDQIQGRNPHYVNHDDELREAVAAVDRAEGNLVIVFSGVAGSGKTSTAKELAFRVKSRFPDGALFARLAGTLTEEGAEAEILRSFLAEFGVPAERIPDRLDALRARYQGVTASKRVLLMLDGAVRASQVRTLLPGDGHSLVLVTEGRTLSDLVVDSSVEFVDLSPLTEEAARELLDRLLGQERVAAEQAAVAELIELCGGLPIALCVVAGMLGRPRNRTIASTVERLRDERRRLVALSPPTDLSVAGVFTAAYRQLGDSAQICYLAMGLPPRVGAVSAEALAAALQRPFYEVAESLAELGESRFIEETGHDRYAVSDLVALHAAYLDDRPAEVRDAETERLLAFYHQRTYDADAVLAPARPWRRALFPELRSRGAFDDPARAAAWLAEERVTVTKLVRHAFERDDLERVCSWCVLLWPFFESGKHIADLLATHRDGIEAAEALRNPALASLIRTQAAYGHYWLRELDKAAALFAAGVGLARDAGVPDLEATALEGLGLTQLELRVPEAEDTLRRNLKLAVGIDDERRVALARLHLAKAEPADVGLRLLAEATAYFDRTSDVVNSAKCAIWQGKHLVAVDRVEEATPILTDAIDAMARLGRRFDQAEALTALGDGQLARDDHDGAKRSWAEALSCYDDLGFTVRADELTARLDRLAD